MDELPDALTENNPGLLSIRGALASMAGDLDLGLRILDKALELISEKDDLVLYIRTLLRRAASHRLLESFQSGLEDALRGPGVDGRNKDDKFLKQRRKGKPGLICCAWD